MLVKTNLLRVEHGATEKEVGGGGIGHARPSGIIPKRVSRRREKSMEDYRALSVEKKGSKQAIGFGP